MKRIMVGISGASGAPIAISLLEHLKAHPEVEVHLVLTKGAELTITSETEYSVRQVKALADYVYTNEEIGAAPASGSFAMDEMIVVPCSMKTVAGIVSGYSDNLLLRACDVTIKEQRPLILVVRESPLSPIHLRNMSELASMGICMMPPMMGYYHHFTTIEEWTEEFARRLMRKLGIETGLKEWNGLKEPDNDSKL